MAELIKFWETVGNIAERAFKVGQFVVDHVNTGGWADLPHAEQAPFTPPARASITYPGAHDVSPTA